jgi:DNA-binding beta-propeller fold protein YncE
VAKISFDTRANEAFVADGYGHKRVAVLDMTTGAVKRFWGAYGNVPVDSNIGPYDPAAPLAQQFRNPVHCAEPSNDGLVYVCDRPNDRIQVFRQNGEFVNEVRVAPETRGDGSVWDIAFSRDPEQKYLYVADGKNEKVYVMDRKSLTILTSFGSGGVSPGSSSPCTRSPPTPRATSSRPRPTRGSGFSGLCIVAYGRYRGAIRGRRGRGGESGPVARSRGSLIAPSAVTEVTRLLR